jgi:hypothetical protein
MANLIRVVMLHLSESRTYLHGDLTLIVDRF